MSTIDALINEFAPNGVAHKALGEIGTFLRGNGLQKKDLTDAGVPAIHYGQIHTHYGTWATGTLSFVTPEFAPRMRRAQPGDLVIATTSEDDEAVAKAVAWLGAGEAVVSGDAFIFRHSMDPKFVAYFFQSDRFQAQKMMGITGAKVRRISGNALANIRIPIPPMEVQREIVKVLDRFAKLEAELEAELEARNVQYAHYRDELLSFSESEDARLVSFGEVATIVRGASPRPIRAFLTDGDDGVNWIKIGDVPPGSKYITTTAQKIRPEGAVKSRRVEPGDFVLSNSMSFGRPYILSIDGCIHDGWLAIGGFSDTYNRDYLYHLLRSSEVYKVMAMKASSGTVQNLNADIVKSLVLPAPPLDEQSRVAEVLDRFDVLVNDLSSGLPAEIAARRKQYEYYRDRLLSFEEAGA